jgi:hypothetical protein
MKSRAYTHIALKQMHNREHKKNCKHTIKIDVNNNHHNTMKWNQSIFILIPVLLYMGSIETTICLYNPTIFVLLSLSILSLQLTITMRIIDYNTIPTRELSRVFPLTALAI